MPIQSSPIQLYAEWLKESERIDPQAPEQPVTTPATQPVANTQVDPSAAPMQPVDPNIETGLEEQPAEEPTLSESEEFEEIDTARKEAITAFKEKQKEYMEIPLEIRNAPVSDEDKTKVESLKAELQTLNTAMKDAVARYDEFNDKMLGSSPDGDSDIEP